MKKLSALILIICMTLTMISIPAFAVGDGMEGAAGTDVQQQEIPSATVPAEDQVTEPEPIPEPESEPEPTITSKPSIQSTPDYLEIIDYLNAKCGTNFKPQTKKTQQLVHARMAEGYTVDDFKTVIDRKSADWKHDPKMCNYLRPETLFGTKFESYLVSHNGVAPVQIQEPQSKYQ